MASLGGIGFQGEAEPLLTAACEVPLTRAILRYRDPQDAALPGGRLADIGMGVVVEERDPGRAEILDLGSGERRPVTVSGPVIILGWVFSSTLQTLREIHAEGKEPPSRSTFALALRVLERSGFDPVTRPLLLRIGFRDVARDLDPHEGTAVRLVLPGERVARIHLEYDTATLTVRTGSGERTSLLEDGLRSAFPQARLMAGRGTDAAGLRSYHLPFELPRSVGETRRFIRRLRRGLLHLLARFEPERYRAVREQVEVFGDRDSLKTLRDGGVAPALQVVDSPATARRFQPGGLGGAPRRVH
jgi:hypothetical protein